MQPGGLISIPCLRSTPPALDRMAAHLSDGQVGYVRQPETSVTWLALAECYVDLVSTVIISLNVAKGLFQ